MDPLQSSSSFLSTSIQDQMSEALLSDNLVTTKVLFALGKETAQINRIAQETMETHAEKAPKILTHLAQAKSWCKEHKRHREQDIIKEIFQLQNTDEAERALRLFLALGGTLNNILQTELPLSGNVDESVTYLEIYRRAINILNEFLETAPAKPKKRKGLFSKFHKSARPTPTSNEIDKAKAMFSRLISMQDKSNIMHTACAKGFKQLIQELIKHGIDIDTPNPITGATALYHVCFNGDADTLRYLINLGADVNAATREKKDTPLHIACTRGHLDVVQVLLNKRADIEAKSTDGNTALHCACDNGHFHVVKLLVDTSPSIINVPNGQGVTPLHFACLQGDASMVKFLLNHGADPTTKDDYRETPFQAALTQALSQKEDEKDCFDKFLQEYYYEYPIILEIAKAGRYDLLLKTLREEPAWFLDAFTKNRAVSPLEIAWLFGDPLLTKTMHTLAPEADYNQALDKLAEKYPENALKSVIDPILSLKKSHVADLGEFSTVPPPPEIELDRLCRFFDQVEFKVSGNVRDYPPEKLFFDPHGNVVFDKREIMSFSELKDLDIGNILFDSKGSILIDGERIPYIIMKAEGIVMPLIVRNVEGVAKASLPLDLLRVLFHRINFTDPAAPGYRDPNKIIDSSHTEEGRPAVISPGQLLENLNTFIYNIKNRVPFVGTPPEENREELEEWYNQLKSRVLHVLFLSLEEDKKAREEITSNPRGRDADPSPSAEAVIDYALAGGWCGTRYLDDSQFLYDIKMGPPKGVREQVLELPRKLKTGIAENMVDRENPHNVHLFNKILQVIDEDSGISEAVKKTRYYFRDPIAPRIIDEDKILEIFWRQYTPTAIIDLVDEAINGKKPAIDRELVIDWFKDNIPEDWQKEKYAHIRDTVDGLSTTEEKKEFLEEQEIYINPPDLKKPEGPNWSRLIDDDRKMSFLDEKRIMDMETGKITRLALLEMLKMIGVLE